MKHVADVPAGVGRPRAVAALLGALLVIGASGALAAQAGSPDADDALFTRATADPELAAALDKLGVARRSGEPLAVQEIEILDAWEEGLPIAQIEARILVSRAIYEVYVARTRTALEIADDLVGRWRTYIALHAFELQTRNQQLNPGLDQHVLPPDGSYEWMLYSDPEMFNQIDGYQRLLERLYGHKGKARARKGGLARGAGEIPEVVPPNLLVNNPGADLTAQDTQSETTIVLGSGANILTSFNDSGSNVGGANHFTGVARSTDGGATFTDNGVLPASAIGDAGDPVLARNNTTGLAILATLGFNSSSVLQTFRTVDNGATYMAPVDGDGGGTNNDKEWLTCDNFPGPGQGNFYMFWRDFGGGGGMSFTRSTDGGATWSIRQVLAAGGQGAWVTVGADHAVYAFWLASGPNRLVLRKSTDQGLTFSAQTTVKTLVTTGVNGGLGLNGGFRTNAFPQIVAHPTNANQLYMTWNDRPSPGSTDLANVYFSHTTDGGLTWSVNVQVNTDAGTQDQFMPCIAITPDGTALYVSWYDRRQDPANSLIGVFARHATVSGGAVTFGLDYRVTDASFPVVIGQDPAINSVYMGDYDVATADNTNFHRTWGDNRLPLNTHANQPDVRYTKVPIAGPGAIMSAGATAVVNELCSPPNGTPDPNEIITISFGVTNNGTAATTNLVGTLQATGGVTNPSGPATYGAVPAGGSASQDFTFTANGTCGGTITASIQLQDGATNHGTVTYTFQLGTTNALTFSNPAAITILDNQPATPYPSNITVSGVTSYNRVTVTLTGLSHTFPDDIDIIVVAPGGQKAYVMSDVGGSGDVTNLNLVFDDNAAATIPDGGPLTAGTWRPSNVDTTTDAFPAPAPGPPYSPNFSVFNGLGGGVNGTWSLYVRDDVGTDAGSISGGWSISFAEPLCSTACVPVELQSFVVE